MRNKSKKANKATPARLPITDPTTFGVGKELLESEFDIDAVVGAGEGRAVFAGSTTPPPPNPPAVLGATTEALLLCVLDVEVGVIEDRVEDPDDVDVEDADDEDDDDDADGVRDDVVSDDEDVLGAGELAGVELAPDSEEDASALDSGAGDGCDTTGVADCALTSFVGTPDGHG